MALRTRGNVEIRQDVDNGRPTIADLQGDNHFVLLAKQHWLKSTKKAAKVKVKPDVVKKEIWDVLEREDFSYRSLLILENLQILGRSASSSGLHCIVMLNHLQLPLARLFGRLLELPCHTHGIDHKCPHP
jgi:intron-binding protein aquarius